MNSVFGFYCGGEQTEPRKGGGKPAALSVGSRSMGFRFHYRSVDLPNQGLSRRRRCYLAIQDLAMGNVIAVHGPVATLVGPHYGAVEADSSKHAVRARVSEDLRS